METRTQIIIQTLKDLHIRPSIYRVRILECLEDNKLHPTADQIYKNLLKEFPTLSKMSVYNTIETLLNAGLIKELTIENNEVRYDRYLSDHGHFKCSVCQRITNFDFNYDKLNISGLEQFEIKQQDVFFRGICPDCLKDRKFHKEDEYHG